MSISAFKFLHGFKTLIDIGDSTVPGDPSFEHLDRVAELAVSLQRLDQGVGLKRVGVDNIDSCGKSVKRNEKERGNEREKQME